MTRFSPPSVALPTLALALVSVSTLIGTVVATGLGGLPVGLSIAMGTASCFAAFTPVHEAAHRNVCRSRPANDLVGHLCAWVLGGALGPYRFVHAAHHRYANHRRRDPDAPLGSGPGWALPLRWALHDLTYLAFYLRHAPQRRWVEVLELAAPVGLVAVVGGAAVAAGPPWTHAVVFGWLLPARLALTLLAATFAWLPHAPHRDTHRFRATTVHSAGWLTPLLLGQNFHGVHHLYPRVPFYRLPAIWKARGPALKAQGMVDRHR